MAANDPKRSRLGGELGRELERIRAALRADKIVSSPGTRVSRTTGGTLLAFPPPPPPPEPTPPPTPRPPNEWRISRQGADMPFGIYTHIEEVYGGTRNRTGRTMFCMGPTGYTHHPPPTTYITIGKYEIPLSIAGVTGVLGDIRVPSPLTELFWPIVERPKGWWKVPDVAPSNWRGSFESTWPFASHTWEEWLTMQGWTKGEILFPNDPTCKHNYAGGCTCGPEPRSMKHTFDSGLMMGMRWLMGAHGSPSIGIPSTWHGYHLTREGIRSFVNKWPYGALVVPSEILAEDGLSNPYTVGGEVLSYYMSSGPVGPEGLVWQPDPYGRTAGQWGGYYPAYGWELLPVPNGGTPKEGFSYLEYTLDVDGNKIYPHGYDLILPEEHRCAPWGSIAPR